MRIRATSRRSRNNSKRSAPAVSLPSRGGEAVEAGIRLARSYTKRTDVGGFTGGFHGKTAGVLPISDIDWKTLIGPLPPGYHIAPYADPTRFNGSPDEC